MKHGSIIVVLVLAISLFAVVAESSDSPIKLQPLKVLPAGVQCEYDTCVGYPADLDSDGSMDLVVVRTNAGVSVITFGVLFYRKDGDVYKAMKADEEDTSTTEDFSGIGIRESKVNGYTTVCAFDFIYDEPTTCFGWDGAKWSKGATQAKLEIAPGASVGPYRIGMPKAKTDAASDKRVIAAFANGAVSLLKTADKDAILALGVKGKGFLGIEPTCRQVTESLKGVMRPWNSEMDCRHTFRVWVDSAKGIAYADYLDTTGISKYCHGTEYDKDWVFVFSPNASADLGLGKEVPCKSE